MIGLKTVARRPQRDEAEKPFWISFSDLMTALMVLFLVAMAVALMAVTQGLQRIEADKLAREEAVRSCVADIGALAQKPEFRGIAVRDNAIEFGALAEFDKSGHHLTATRQEFLRRFVPQVLAAARDGNCSKWLKRIVVEGFASQEGSYLYNLNLSLQRSQRVLCVLLDAQAADAPSAADRRTIRKLFLVGGSSFNALKRNAEESRRVELQLEFRELDERQAVLPEIPWDEDPKCPLDPP
ncbi:MAG: flagellar motor protein MotB [Rhodocyclaceae bacterium]|nr:flagellar motor protein MotB [Rhodocyclaceae bacterium]